MICNSHCSHGGVCILTENHEEKHDSRYCQWTDEEAISKEEADQLFLLEAKFQGAEQIAELMIAIEDQLMARLKELEEEENKK
jgi:hypothetical protein